MKNFLFSILLISSLCSCKKENKDTPAPANQAEESAGNTGCKPMWYLFQPDPAKSTSATVANGLLSLSANTTSSIYNAGVYQKYLEGDFQMSIKFQDLKVSDYDKTNIFSMMVQNAEISEESFSATGQVTPGSCVAFSTSESVGKSENWLYSASSIISSGYIEMTRVKDTISTQIKIDGKVVCSDRCLVSSKFKSLKAQITLGGNIGGSSPSPASVKVDEFRITGGGGKVFADSFDCDNIIK
ncbi:MAG TPA: hypothetical protein VF691_22495 [Cytophagaceae bacterium]|jgi:hypothetical protein